MCKMPEVAGVKEIEHSVTHRDPQALGSRDFEALYQVVCADHLRVSTSKGF